MSTQREDPSWGRGSDEERWVDCEDAITPASTLLLSADSAEVEQEGEGSSQRRC